MRKDKTTREILTEYFHIPEIPTVINEEILDKTLYRKIKGKEIRYTAGDAICDVMGVTFNGIASGVSHSASLVQDTTGQFMKDHYQKSLAGVGLFQSNNDKMRDFLKNKAKELQGKTLESYEILKSLPGKMAGIADVLASEDPSLTLDQYEDVKTALKENKVLQNLNGHHKQFLNQLFVRSEDGKFKINESAKPDLALKAIDDLKDAVDRVVISEENGPVYAEAIQSMLGDSSTCLENLKAIYAENKLEGMKWGAAYVLGSVSNLAVSLVVGIMAASVVAGVLAATCTANVAARLTNIVAGVGMMGLALGYAVVSSITQFSQLFLKPFFTKIGVSAGYVKHGDSEEYDKQVDKMIEENSRDMFKQGVGLIEKAFEGVPNPLKGIKIPFANKSEDNLLDLEQPRSKTSGDGVLLLDPDDSTSQKRGMKS